MKNQNLESWRQLLAILKAQNTLHCGVRVEYQAMVTTAGTVYEELLTELKRANFPEKLDQLTRFLSTEEGMLIRGLCTQANKPFWLGLFTDSAATTVFEFHLWAEGVVCTVTLPSNEKKSFPVEFRFALIAQGVSSRGWYDLEGRLREHANYILDINRALLIRHGL